MNKKVAAIPADYADWLSDIKNRVTAARQRAALAANGELIGLYWQIGRDILQRQSAQGWGSKVIERLARDLREAFPEMKGFSRANLLYMRAFAEIWPDEAIVQQLAGQLPWFHNVILMTRLKEHQARVWYARQAIAEGWSRATLEVQIRHRLHERQGQAITNFSTRLPATHSQLAHETLKDPYLFDFLGLGDDAHEREIENALVRHITKFLLELGSGFAFMGRQYRLEVDGSEFFIDLLFYHTRLKCHVVVELKATAFKPARHRAAGVRSRFRGRDRCHDLDGRDQGARRHRHPGGPSQGPPPPRSGASTPATMRPASAPSRGSTSRCRTTRSTSRGGSWTSRASSKGSEGREPSWPWGKSNES